MAHAYWLSIFAEKVSISVRKSHFFQSSKIRGGFKGSPNESQFIFLNNVGGSRIRLRMTLNFEWRHLEMILKDPLIQIRSRSMSDPTLSDITFINEMARVWTTLKRLKSG